MADFEHLFLTQRTQRGHREHGGLLCDLRASSMNSVSKKSFLTGMILGSLLSAIAQPLPHTAPLTVQGDLSAQMIAGIDRFLERETTRVAGERDQYWRGSSVEPNRERFVRMIGLIDQRVPHVEVEYVATTETP